MSRDLGDEEVASTIDRCLTLVSEAEKLSLQTKLSIRREVFNSMRRLDMLTEYLEDESVSEIMVNGYQTIFIEKDGKIIQSEKSFESEEKLMAVIQQIVAGCNRRVNESNPIVDARLPSGERVNIVIKPVALSGPTLTIRRFPKHVLTMQRLVQMGTVSSEVADILRILVVSGYNIFISGGTGSGKTTFLNALSEYIPADERIITIEDAAELQIRGIRNLVRLESRAENLEGKNEISIRRMIKTSLRMRPDRIIVGEVRDEAAIDMLAAMNTGHDGSISTGHANSCEDMITRLCTMVLMGMELPLLAIRQQIASAVDVIIHVSRMRDHSRKVTKICEVYLGDDGDLKLRPLYEFREKDVDMEKVNGTLVQVNTMVNTQKIKNAGLLEEFKNAEGQTINSYNR